MLKEITSLKNPVIKKIVSLKSNKGRETYNEFFLEGTQFVREIPNQFLVSEYIVSESFKEKNDISFFENRALTYVVSDKIFEKISETINPQGILAVLPCKDYSLNDFLDKDGLIVYCENLNDPGNLGTIIRTSAAANCLCLVLSSDCVSLYNPKVLRSAAGAFFHLPVIENSNIEDLSVLKNRGFEIIATSPNTEKLIYDIDFCDKKVVLVGNEANGLSKEAFLLSDISVKIPMSEKIESLNASVSLSILVYEAVRQKNIKGE